MIRIVNWDRFQHYNKRRPPWIKLYRELRTNRQWRQCSHGASKLLVDCWTLASESERGVINMDIDDLAFEVRESVADVQRWLQELETKGFIETLASCYHDASNMLPPEVEVEGEVETEAETEKPAFGANVENSLWLEVKSVAYDELGMGKLSMAEEQKNRSIINAWRYQQERKPEDVLAAVKGAVDLRDNGGTWLEQGQPYTLAALFNTDTLADQGDGDTVRSLWSVAQERYYSEDKQKGKRRNAGPTRIHLDVGGAA